MKKILPLLLIFFFSALTFAEEWPTPKAVECPSVWARSGKITLTAPEPGVSCIRYSGEADYCATCKDHFQVKMGEIYELSCDVSTTGSGSVGISVVLGRGNEPIEWVYANEGFRGETPNGEFRHLTSKFIVPGDRTFLYPRVTGVGEKADYQIRFKNFTIRKTGEVACVTDAKPYVLESDSLRVTFDGTTAAFQVQDLRSGRVWKQILPSGSCFLKEAKLEGKTLAFTALNALTVEEFRVELTLRGSELTVRLTGDPSQPMPGPVAYPFAFESQPNDRIILPINEGISFPVTEEAPGAYRLVTYGGHGICMGFWAQCEETFVPAKGSDPAAPNQAGEVTGKSGYLAIFETSDDAVVETYRDANSKLLAARAGWNGQKKKLGYDRVLRYVFFDRADVTAMLKYYRAYAQSIGLVVPFTEKVKRNPNLKKGFDLLIGAANVWYFGGNKIKIYSELQAAGVRKILASAGGSAEEIRQMNEMPGILTSRYDIYQDSMDPANTEAIGYYSSSWTGDAWAKGELMIDENGDWIRGWRVAQKDKTKPMIPCGVLCDACAVPYERERVSKELTSIPYRARFIDTTTASPWRECWDPKHPCTRTDSRKAKMELLGILGSEFNLVTGSETGHEASVPYCDFYEGMMSLGPYRVPDSGRNIPEIWDEAPERTEKYQVGETYRMPLWELVYHDCTVSYWYWGDYNNKLPSLWVKRDLFNALYGVPPMFVFTGQNYPEFKDRIIASYAVSQPVSEKTGWHEMTSFRVISRDRTVQETTFANGVRVTANFGDRDYSMPDGFVLKAKTTRVEE